MDTQEPPTSRELRTVAVDDETVAPLLAGLGEEYTVRYGAIDEMNYAAAEEFEPPGGVFFVVLEDGVTVAGGGFRRISDDTCEVKRVWTSPQHRRRGLAGVVLDALEAAAEAAGYRTVRLETGPAQPEAVAFYSRRGYRRIPVYGRYEEALAFERPLDSPASQRPSIHIGIDCAEPESLAPFWAAALGYELTEPSFGGVYLMLRPATPGDPVVYFQKVPEAKVVKNRLHLDLRVADADALIARLVALGGSRLGEPRSGSTCAWWQVMSDPAGNEFCVCSESC